jgi:succinoglycan biosynthesis transport protein ExoP
MRHALRRYRWFILLLTAASVGVGLLVTRVMRPEYTADTMLWIDGGTRGATTPTGPVRPRQVFDAEAWSSLLRSYAVLEGVVHDARLFLETRPGDADALRSGMTLQPRFTEGKYKLSVDDDGKQWTLELRSTGTVIAAGLWSVGAATLRTEKGAVGDSVGRAFGFGWRPSAATLQPGREYDFTIRNPRTVAAQLRENLGVRIDEQANFLSVELTGTDPRLVASTLNALGSRYVAQAAQLQRQNLAAYREIIDVQLQSARQQLTEAERELQEFRVANATLPGTMEAARGPAGAVTGESYYGLVSSLENARRERELLESALAGTELKLPVLQRVATLDESSELTDAIAELTVKRNELRALRYRYAEAHPPIERLRSEIATLEREIIPPLARDAIDRMRQREAALEPRVAASAATLREIPARDREEIQLRRNAALAGAMYESLQTRANDLRLAEQGTIAEVRVLDRAIAPSRPTKDTQGAILLFSLFGGLLVTGGLAVAMDRSDKKFRYPEQVTKELGLTILGAVPHLKADATGLVRQKTSTPFQDAMRDIRLNLAYAHGQNGPMMLTVTSPGSNDGKSFLATHLARTFADGGQRTLLIDGDLRRGQLNVRFGQARRPGLSEYLRGANSRDDVVVRTNIPNLDFIASGGRHRDSSELLASAAMPQLLGELLNTYDVVISDSPPLSAGVDAVLLGAATTNMLLVVRTGVSQREVAAARLEVIGRLPVRVIGAVLNDVPENNSAFSYYTHYTLPGYESRSEEDLVTTETRSLSSPVVP